MKRLSWILALPVFGFMATLSPVRGQTPAAITIDAAAVTGAVEDYMRQNAVPGAIVVITDGPDVVYARGLGRDSRGRLITADAPFPIASLSKSFAALAVMQLVEERQLELDRPVASYLRDFALADPRYTAVTVRQLLAHRSGMSDATFREKSVTPVPALLEEAVRSLKGAALFADPGSRRSYHNPNYWVAARLVEVVSGAPFAVYLRDRVFLPLGMVNTTTVASLEDVPDVAPGFIRVLGRDFSRKEPAWFLDGCCGVVTTANDLARWLSFHARAEREEGATSLISPASVRVMHDGLGWSTLDAGTDRRRVSHNGMTFTFSARQDVLPEVGRGLGIGVVTNTGVGLAPLDADAMADMLRTLILDGRIEQPARVALIVDIVLAGLIVVTPLVAWFRLRSTRERRRVSPPWRRVAAHTALLLPALWLAFYPASVRALTSRDLNWEQSLAVSPLVVVFVAVLASTCAVTLAVRLRPRTNK